VTFNPTAPGTPTPRKIDSRGGGGGGAGVACSSTSQCTAVDQDRHAVTFNPTSPGSPTPTTVDSYNQLDAVACTSTSQCSAVDAIGDEVTFSPRSPGSTTSATIDTSGAGGAGLDAVSCPSTNQCTAVDDSGHEVTFKVNALGPASVPPPVLGKSVDVAPVSGVVLLEQPGKKGFVRLRAGERVPVGSTIDTTAGVVSLTAALNARGKTTAGRFYAGQFRLTQKRARTAEETVLTLTGPKPTGCAAGVATAARKKPRKRSLWGSASGGYRTVGSDGSATELGSEVVGWLTEDTCAGTLIRVTQGAVLVEDFPHHRSLILRAPHSFLAHPGKGG
jgi:hypothetical protein